MYTLKSIAQRSTMLGAAAALIVAAVVPAASVFADALNPLTERSLLLSSSAPGYKDTDGSGNSETSLNANGETFAPPGSGPNGKKTGETFSFNVSSDSTTRSIKGMTFQYCTSAAGNCQSPGDNWKVNGAATNPNNDANGDGDFRNGTDHTANGRATNAVAHPLGFSDLDVVGTFTPNATATSLATLGDGEFAVIVNGVAQSGWTMDAIRREDSAHTKTLTGKNNYIRLANASGATPTPGQSVKVIFKPSSSVFITNPGSGSFFVKINTYDTNTLADLVAGDPSVIDGGVTVANVMTDSIHITTKVLETMAFSVGTRNRDTVTLNCGVDFGQPTQPEGCEAASGAVHGPCDPIQQPNSNRLQLGDPDAEYSLDTNKAYEVSSYWRLSSNSSGGATVYYSGNTLANTVGDEIAEMDTETISTPGVPQFGLAFGDLAGDTMAEGTPAPTLSPFNLSTDAASADYNEAGAGTTIDDGAGHAGTAKFKFLKSSLTIPEPIAQQNNQVISCATAKMRYVGNIGADTPAGVYTTKINYLAAPQY